MCSERPELPCVDPGPIHFWATRGFWIVSRYADVLTALSDPRFAFEGERQAATPPPPRDNRSRWQGEIGAAAARLAGRVPSQGAFDLAGRFYEYGLELALVLCSVNEGDAARLADLARSVIEGAANPFDDSLRLRMHAAVSDLSQSIDSPPLGVQTFVAVSQTLPRFLTAAWLALVSCPNELASLKRNVDEVPAATEELLRLAGPSQAVFRTAIESATLGDVDFEPGDRLALMIAAANRDSAVFDDPSRLKIDRRAVKHLALGAGAHSCAGASLVRMAANAAIKAIVEMPVDIELAETPAWDGGFAIRWPRSLRVTAQQTSPWPPSA